MATMTANGAANGAPPSSQTANALIYPALHLFPLNDTFVPKQILLAPPGERIKIGRQTNAKTVPNSTNGYFDSKVLSRMHAEVWCEEAKVYIKDVKSSNGTFINGDRLSAEGVESDVFELHSEDIVEFGIDIVSDDNKTIIHHKVAAKVHLVFTAEDALMMNKNMPNYFRSVHDAQLSRRASKPGQANFSFDHVLTRLQSELQKSRETGNELSAITGTMSDIHDTLGGTAPLPAYTAQGRIPAMMPPPGPRDPHAQTIAALQAQLSETQLSLAQHADKVRGLESLLAEHDTIKSEVSALRMQMDEAKREMEALMRGGGGRGGSLGAWPADRGEGETDDSDTRSIASMDTIRPHSPSSNEPSQANGQPEASASSASPPAPPSQPSPEHDRLAARVEALAAELAEATALGTVLRSQHSVSSESSRALEDRMSSLESRLVSAETGTDGRWDGWKRAFEASWQRDREEWTQERSKLLAAIADWERAREATSGSDDFDDEEDAAEAAGPVPSTSASSSPALHGSYPRSPLGPAANGVAGRSAKKPRRRRRRSTATTDSTSRAVAGNDITATSRGWTTALAEGHDDDDATGGSADATPEPTMRQDSGPKAPDRSSRSLASSSASSRKSSADGHSTALPLASAIGVIVMGIAVWTVVRKDT